MINLQTIAIDGPAASGKSTLGEKIAEKLRFLFLDTGIMYRAVTLEAIQKLSNTGLGNEEMVTKIAEESIIEIKPSSINDGRKSDVYINGVEITKKLHLPDVDENVSNISTFSGVRKALSAQQRAIGLKGKVVMVGRDIGTVVIPEADIKIFLEASAEERAKRRYIELQAKNINISFDSVIASINKRDQIDESRDLAPLVKAKDAFVIITDNINIDQVIDIAMKYIEEKRSYRYTY